MSRIEELAGRFAQAKKVGEEAVAAAKEKEAAENREHQARREKEQTAEVVTAVAGWAGSLGERTRKEVDRICGMLEAGNELSPLDYKQYADTMIFFSDRTWSKAEVLRAVLAPESRAAFDELFDAAKNEGHFIRIDLYDDYRADGSRRRNSTGGSKMELIVLLDTPYSEDARTKWSDTVASLEKELASLEKKPTPVAPTAQASGPLPLPPLPTLPQQA